MAIEMEISLSPADVDVLTFWADMLSFWTRMHRWLVKQGVTGTKLDIACEMTKTSRGALLRIAEDEPR